MSETATADEAPTDDVQFTHPIETELSGFVALSLESRVGVGAFSKRHPERLRRSDDAVVTTVARARDLLREHYNWELPSEAEIRQQAMTGSTARPL